MTEPWYSPDEITVALGVTLPVFVYVSYRAYELILDHRAALRRFCRAEWAVDLVTRTNLRSAANDISSQLAVAAVYSRFDEDVLSRRRALRGTAHILVLIGFIGTLIGVSGAFGALVLEQGNTRGTVVQLVERLLSGGLATALVSSLVAAIISVLILAYLTGTEGRVTRAKHELLQACRAALDAPRTEEDGHVAVS